MTPPTAEALMRSRYTAYALCRADYILDTHDPATRGPIDRAAVERWAREAHWRGLEVLATERGGPDDDEGVVEFRARYDNEAGQARVHHERSTFRRADGRWLYVDGSTPRQRPATRAATAGRNDPCPCGSGKKYKKCCGANA